MLVLDIRHLFFNIKELYFSEEPFDIPNCDAVIFHNCSKKLTKKGFFCSPSLTNYINLNRDLDDIFKEFHKKSTRNAILKAEKERIEVRVNKDYDEFYNMNQLFMKKKGIAPLLNISFDLDILKKYGTLFTAKLSGELIGGNIYLEDDNYLRLWISASKRLQVSKQESIIIGNSNRLLHWEAIKYAKEKGLKWFDWGGLWDEKEALADINKYNINSFKLSFGGVTVQKYDYIKDYTFGYSLMKRMYILLNKVSKYF